MTAIPFTARVQIPDYVLIQELDGEAVLLNLKSETYFGLDEVGMRMWQALTTSPSIQNACDHLLKEYEVQPDKLQADMDELLGKLVEHGLVQISND